MQHQTATRSLISADLSRTCCPTWSSFCRSAFNCRRCLSIDSTSDLVLSSRDSNSCFHAARRDCSSLSACIVASSSAVLCIRSQMTNVSQMLMLRWQWEMQGDSSWSASLAATDWYISRHRLRWPLLLPTVCGVGRAYFKDVCMPITDIAGWIHLRSAKRHDLLVPRTRTGFSQQSFYTAAHTVWNSLPTHLHSASISCGQFRDGQTVSICGALSRYCFFHLRRIRSINQSLTSEATRTLVNAFVSSRLDGCNSLLAGVSSQLLNKLQVIQNAAARLVTGARRSEHMTPVLRDLHWLPIRQRVTFKTAVLVYKCQQGTAPLYLREYCQPLSSVVSRQRRSAHSGWLTVPRTRTNYDDRSFAVQGPRTWSSLPADLQAPDISVETFRHKLKTFLFAVWLSIQRISCTTRFCAIKMHLIIKAHNCQTSSCG